MHKPAYSAFHELHELHEAQQALMIRLRNSLNGLRGMEQLPGWSDGDDDFRVGLGIRPSWVVYRWAHQVESRRISGINSVSRN